MSTISQTPREIIKGQNPPTLGGGMVRIAVPPRLSGAIGFVDAAIIQQLAWVESRDKAIVGRGVECSAKMLHKEMGHGLDVKTVNNAIKRMIAMGLIDEIRPFSGATKAIWAVNVEACDAATAQYARDLINKSAEDASTTVEGAPVSPCTENGSPSVNRKRVAIGEPKTGHAVTQKRVTPRTENGARGDPKTGHQNDSHLYSDIVDKLDRLDTAAQIDAAQDNQVQNSNIKTLNQTQSPAPEMATERPKAALDSSQQQNPPQAQEPQQTPPKSPVMAAFQQAVFRMYGLQVPEEHKAMLNSIYRRTKEVLGESGMPTTAEMWESIIAGERNRVSNPVATPNPQNRPSRGGGIFADANPYAARAYGRGSKSGESSPVLDAPPAPASWDELMNEVVEGQKLLDHLSSKYPAYDGNDGRPALKSVLDGCKEYYLRGQRKIPLPSQVENWVAKDHHRHLAAYEESRGIFHAPAKDKHGNLIKLSGDRRWNLDDRAHWYNAHWWVQESQEWADSDPKEARAQISPEEEARAKAAFFGGLERLASQLKGEQPRQPKKDDVQRRNDSDDAQRQVAARILVENSISYHQKYGDPQGAFDPRDVRGFPVIFPEGYRISEVDRCMCIDGCLWHPLMGWVKRKNTPSKSTLLTSETGDPIGMIGNNESS